MYIGQGLSLEAHRAAQAERRAANTATAAAPAAAAAAAASTPAAAAAATESASSASSPLITIMVSLGLIAKFTPVRVLLMNPSIGA